MGQVLTAETPLENTADHKCRPSLSRPLSYLLQKMLAPLSFVRPGTTQTASQEAAPLLWEGVGISLLLSAGVGAMSIPIFTSGQFISTTGPCDPPVWALCHNFLQVIILKSFMVFFHSSPPICSVLVKIITWYFIFSLLL